MKKSSHSRNRRLISQWLFIYVLTLIWSGIKPHNTFVWFLEVLPALCGLLILVFTYRYFRFTELAYWLMLLHAIILMIGGHYTYAEVPIFNWLRDTFDLSRNHYDKVGHFAQGFIPAIVAREILIRKSPVKTGTWLFFIVVCICLSVSAFYEFIEWWVAEATGTAADAFLGTQGYIWDTQSDMFMALLGAVTSLILLGRFHDKSIANLPKS